MDQTEPAMPVLSPAPPGDPGPEVAALARRWKAANGPVMALVTRMGGALEKQLTLLPDGMRGRIEAVTAQALEQAYGMARRGDAVGGALTAALPEALAGRLHEGKGRGSLAAVLASGAAGGMGGIATSIAELPFTITVLLHAIRREAEKAGFDPDDPWIRAEALRTFGAGSPVSADDGIDTSFFTARLTLTGPAVQTLIAQVAPRLAAALGQKLAAQAVPVLGAVSGAALNAAFLRWYREAAAVRFALLRLSDQHGAGPVLQAFAAATAPAKITKAGWAPPRDQDAPPG